MFSYKIKRVLRGIVNIAKEFNIIPIASGIDSQELLDFAKEVGFEYAIGDFVGKAKIIKQY